MLDADRVGWVGDAAGAPAADVRFDAERRAVLPGWVDSHTHLLFAGDRSAEFAARMAGEPYAAGGIAVTVAATRAASDEQLAATLARHVAEAVREGTTTLETKTGYGLTVADERRAAAVAAADPGVDEVTFLGAHLVPPGAEPDEYLALVIAAHDGRGGPVRRLGRRVLRAGCLRRRGQRGGVAGRRRRTGSACGCTATSSVRGRASRWRSGTARPAWTTAPTCRWSTSTRWPPGPRWPPCSRPAT